MHQTSLLLANLAPSPLYPLPPVGFRPLPFPRWVSAPLPFPRWVSDPVSPGGYRPPLPNREPDSALTPPNAPLDPPCPLTRADKTKIPHRGKHETKNSMLMQVIMMLMLMMLK